MALKVIGVVGRLCCGKTYLCSELASSSGVVWVNCDQLAHRIYAENVDGVLESLVALFGPAAVRDGTADRAVIGKIVFEDPEALRALNALVWPLMRRELERVIAEQRERAEARAVLLEAAVLYEAGWEDLCDEVWAVEAPIEVARERARARGLSEAAFAARWAAQPPPPASARRVSSPADARHALF